MMDGSARETWTCFSRAGAGNSPPAGSPNFGFKPTYILMIAALLTCDYITNEPKSYQPCSKVSDVIGETLAPGALRQHLESHQPGLQFQLPP